MLASLLLSRRSRRFGLLSMLAVAIALLAAGQPIFAQPSTTPSPVPEAALRPLPTGLLTAPETSYSPVESPMPTPTLQATPPPQSTPLRKGASEVQPAGPVHTVRAGDSLWQIAVWHRVELAVLLRWNPEVAPRALVAGQRISVPGGSAMPVRSTSSPTRSAPAVHTIKPRTWSAAAPVSTGSHRWPLPVRGIVTTRFSSVHPGIDIAAPAGTPVRAIAAGTVVYAGWKNNGGGNVVVLQHPDGMISTYNHTLVVAVTVGERVVSGQQIARVGSTGNATGPHLDLRIEMDGRYVDPLRLL